MRASLPSRVTLLVAASLALPSLFACLDHPLKDVEYDNLQLKDVSFPIAANKDVDILFVIDNSGSMGEEQATLAANFEAFIDVLEAPKVDASYRIGITTTDNGNPWCSGTGSEAGALRMTSCRSRPTEFVFEGDTLVDATQEACYDICPEEWSDIEIQPSLVDGEDEAKPRPWLERIGGATNLPEGLSTVQALQCMGPQGIDGCGFESHLESMWKALRRAQTDDDPAHGFIRDGAILSVVHVTDEEDCSYSTAWESIFMPDGEKTFWSDPTAASPTSAVCWNAGVACEGSDCKAVNLDVAGNEVSDDAADDDAVLRPVERYTEVLQALEEQKQRLDPTQEVLVAMIGGVNSDGSVSYGSALSDPKFQADFGVGPGCESPNGRAVPPVRMREFSEAMAVGDRQNMFSICDSDYSQALEAIADDIIEQVKPACMPTCVADTDPTTPDELDPTCTLTQHTPQADGDFVDTNVPECLDGDTVPEGSDACYIARTGDARHQDCQDAGFNLEFVIVRRDGVAVRGGTGIEATCQLSQSRALDCPDLV